MNASIAEVDVVPTNKEVTKTDITDTPNPKFKTKTIVGKTVPMPSKKKAVKRASPHATPVKTKKRTVPGSHEKNHVRERLLYTDCGKCMKIAERQERQLEKKAAKKAPNEASTSTGGAKPKTSQPSTSKGNKNKSDGEPWACAICGFEGDGSIDLADHADEACATTLIRMLGEAEEDPEVVRDRDGNVAKIACALCGFKSGKYSELLNHHRDEHDRKGDFKKN